MKIARFHLLLLLAALLTVVTPQANAGVEWCTFFGGSAPDMVSGIALDPEGNVYVTGWTESADFPISSGAYDPTWNGERDAFVAKLDPSGSTMLYSTLLGGTGLDWCNSLAVDSEGNAYITGVTRSLNFPVTPGAFQTTRAPDGDDHSEVFVAKVSASGSDLIYSTFIGGQLDDVGMSIALDADGRAYVTGNTISSDFPTIPGGYDTHFDEIDGFVVKLNPAGSELVYATFLGSGYTSCNAIAVDSQGSAYITGFTDASDFPVTPGAFDITYNAGETYVFGDAFVTKLNPSGSALMYSTFLGGEEYERANGIAIDDLGNAYVCGWTTSPDFPTSAHVYDSTAGSLYDDAVFVAKLDSWGRGLVYSTFLGRGEAYSIDVDADGNACICGNLMGTAKLDASAGTLPYSCILGDVEQTTCYCIVVDTAGDMYIAGSTDDADLSVTAGALDTTYNGRTDVFVAKLHPNPIAASQFWSLYY